MLCLLILCCVRFYSSSSCLYCFCCFFFTTDWSVMCYDTTQKQEDTAKNNIREKNQETEDRADTTTTETETQRKRKQKHQQKKTTKDITNRTNTRHKSNVTNKTTDSAHSTRTHVVLVYFFFVLDTSSYALLAFSFFFHVLYFFSLCFTLYRLVNMCFLLILLLIEGYGIWFLLIL